MKPSQTDRILAMLQTAGAHGVTTAQMLQQHIGRHGARIGELRGQGYVITSQRETTSRWRYRLESEPRVSELGATSPSRGGMGNAVASSSDTLFDSPARSTSRSAITGKPLEDEAA